MKYFIDTEFIEGFNKPLFEKKRHFIDLISIGIICEDGREYSAISNEWKWNKANEWVRNNVIIPLYTSTVNGDERNYLDASDFHKKYGKSNKQIAHEIRRFIYDPILDKYDDGMYSDGIINQVYDQNLERETFYGYFADYDWVLFCSLFGTMMDLPKGFPMYCYDLKQKLDDLVYKELKADNVHPSNISHLTPFYLDAIKNNPNYPRQTNEHNALSDAKWNFELYKFLIK